ncbi:MAG: dTDP-4-dehydrorhamnose 3,5-epimerase family protein [Oligoflexia bacterium]|nr:dTDP-4-dehydrorhamnose 3,5-epimerase family protein [Oligoflexia bacterium]
MSTQLNVQKTNLDGVLLISPPTQFEDFRGRHVELYNEKLYREAGIDQHFCQDNISVSNKNVLRGVHGDAETWKLISCLVGSLYLLVINNDSKSAQYRKWQAFTLSETNRSQVLVPPHFGNGHLVLSEQAVFAYKQTTYYNRAGQFTLYWNDPDLKLWWPVTDPIVSQRDDGYRTTAVKGVS